VLLVAHRTPATRAACERLAADGARVFESDIQIADGERIVVSHFLPFARVLQRDNWRVRWHTSAAADPLLTDVAALVPQHCLILLDIKEKRRERTAQLLSALAGALPQRSRYRVCGGRPADLDTVRAAGFATWRTVRNRRELRAVLALDELPDEAVSIRHTLLSADVVAQLHARVPTVVAWTVNSSARARELRELGVDGLTTDRPAIMREQSAAD
jgi:glycerophosphoryl diester phosphodiesterase